MNIRLSDKHFRSFFDFGVLFETVFSYNKSFEMNYRPNFLLALSLQFVCFVSVLEAYSNGSLTDACYTMAPVHGDAQPNTGPCLYETALSEVSYSLNRLFKNNNN